jgi:8-oxo-dGTP pyrophosphatase MutT (NUDIX family)
MEGYDISWLIERVSRSQHGDCDPADYDAAVAVIYETPSKSIILVERIERQGDPWSGHIAFPGGFRKPGERSYETAAREVMEEIGADLGGSIHLGEAGMWITRGIVRVVPHIFVSLKRLETKPGEEVMRVIRARLEDLVETGCPENIPRPPCYILPGIGGKYIWGLTARIISWLMRHERTD